MAGACMGEALPWNSPSPSWLVPVWQKHYQAIHLPHHGWSLYGRSTTMKPHSPSWLVPVWQKHYQEIHLPHHGWGLYGRSTTMKPPSPSWLVPVWVPVVQIYLESSATHMCLVVSHVTCMPTTYLYALFSGITMTISYLYPLFSSIPMTTTYLYPLFSGIPMTTTYLYALFIGIPMTISFICIVQWHPHDYILSIFIVQCTQGHMFCNK